MEDVTVVQEKGENKMYKKKVIIDCDPGIDDSLALMYALSAESVEVVGITIVCGNVPVELGVKNAFKVLKLMDRLDIPVYQGEALPLVRDYVSAQDTHGTDGLGESHIEEVNGICHQDAARFIVDTLRSQEEISILALGPMTNIAKALELDRDAFEKMNRLVSMGGNFKSHGNCSPVAEYNYWCDPDAARDVYETLEQMNKKVEMVGLDVTRKIVLTPNILSYIKRINEERGTFVEKIVQFYFDFHWEYERVIGCVINDPLAVAYFVHPELCNGFDAYTTVETQGVGIGQSITDQMEFWKKQHNSYVCTEVNARAFMEEFIHKVFGGSLEEIREILQQIMIEV